MSLWRDKYILKGVSPLVFSGFQTVRVGVVGTPVGTVTLSCAYRTNLAFMSNRYLTRAAYSDRKRVFNVGAPHDMS